jgi:hypothetical protein
MGYVYYKEFGKIFDEWRKTLLISPCE